MSLDEFKAYLENRKKPLDDRMKTLVTSVQNFNFSDRAYLGQVLLDVITKDEEENLKSKVVQLRAKVLEWRNRIGAST